MIHNTMAGLYALGDAGHCNAGPGAPGLISHVFFTTFGVAVLRSVAPVIHSLPVLDLAARGTRVQEPM